MTNDDFQRLLSRVAWGTNRYEGTLCLEWTGALAEGYGQFVPKGEKIASVHRAAYERWVGPIPTGFHIDHLCRNRKCLNTNHLEAVTPKVNILRGAGISADNARKTYCQDGHPLSGDNLYLIPSTGNRQCRICKKELRRRYRS